MASTDLEYLSVRRLTCIACGTAVLCAVYFVEYFLTVPSSRLAQVSHSDNSGLVQVSNSENSGLARVSSSDGLNFHRAENVLRADYRYFWGPSRVPHIPEADFVQPKWDKKYFIYNSSQMCGSFADRQKGIVAAFIISQILKRQFGIIMRKPCYLPHLLEASNVNWIVNMRDINRLTSKTVLLLDKAAQRLRNKMVQMNIENNYKEDVVFFTVNQEFVQYLMKNPQFKTLKWAQNKTVPEIYNIVLRRLFQLTGKLKRGFHVFEASVRREGRQLVCVHWPTRPPTSPQISAAREFLKTYNDRSRFRIFVASDMEKVRQEARRLFPSAFAYANGNITNKGDSVPCEGFARVILDQMILSTCDVFLMTDSGLGRVAAMLRGTDSNLYFLKNGRTATRKIAYTDKEFLPNYW